MRNILTPLLIIVSILKWSQQDTVEQPDPELAVKEEGNVTLTCSLKTSDPNPYVHWYSQLPGQPPRYMVYIAGENIVKKNPDVPERFAFKFTKSTKHAELTISMAIISDCAMYFCAMTLTLIQSNGTAPTKTHAESAS